ncbi:hypothetical protein LIER_34905 [Lithospermum erythrorhizon]|uniref:Uncharacterized protein n=1 Tax=Lithospermum erythrorhizon TaxID=34254 RepID=A0AAV3NKF3_LITER
MDDGRRKLPSWMLGVKNNENNCDKSSKNGCQKEESNGKLVKGKRVSGKRRKNDLDDDEFEPESSDVPIGDGGDRRMKRKVNGGFVYVEGDDESIEGKKRGRGTSYRIKGNVVDDMVDDEFEQEASDVSIGDGGDRWMKRKMNGGSGYVEGDDESREGKKRGRGTSNKMKSNVVDDMVDDGIGYGNRRNIEKVRKEKIRSNIVDGDDYGYVDGENGIEGEKGSNCGRKRKGIGGNSGVPESKKPELEEDEAEAEDYGGAEVVMRKCKGKRRADRRKFVDSNDLVDVQGTSVSTSDEEDLTVEDLVSIAEEYVNKDMEAAQKLSLSNGVSNVGNLMSIRGENPKESEEIVENHTCETSIHDNTREEARPDGVLNENVTVIKPIMTGDPTQDMLDLFLGHLLKRPQEEEKKMDISLAVPREEPVAVPFTKKKSSLKDKVAMFFD